MFVFLLVQTWVGDLPQLIYSVKSTSTLWTSTNNIILILLRHRRMMEMNSRKKTRVKLLTSVKQIFMVLFEDLYLFTKTKQFFVYLNKLLRCKQVWIKRVLMFNFMRLLFETVVWFILKYGLDLYVVSININPY